MDTKPISVKVVVDKATDKVVFAESDIEFVDILLSYLTLPLGTVVRLLGKQSSIGCIDKLYGSVESLEGQFLMTEACRTMLLRPRNTAIPHCRRLHIHLDDKEPSKYFTCKKCHRISFFNNVRCLCLVSGTTCTELNWFNPDTDIADGVFLRTAKFAISDDMVVAPAWDITTFLERFDIVDWSRLEERVVEIGHSEILDLLKRFLLSETPLTDAFLQKESHTSQSDSKPKLASSKSVMQMASKSKITQDSQPTPDNIDADRQTKETDSNSNVKKIILKLVLNNKRLLYAKSNHDFVDLLFSFLTFPMGSIGRHLNSKSCLGCLDSLYESAKYLSSAGCLKKEYEELLLNPKHPLYYSCKSQVIRINEEPLLQYFEKIQKNTTPCQCMSKQCCPYHDAVKLPSYIINPKISTIYASENGGYSRNSTVYMVTDELVVTPFSIISGMQFHKGAKGTPEEMEIEIGEAEALEVLTASLTSKTALTDAFLSKAVVKIEGQGT